MGLKTLAVCAAAVALGAPSVSVDYLAGRQQADGGYAEAGGSSSPGLTGWTVLALAAAGRRPGRPEAAAAYLARQEAPAATDLELQLLALAALGQPVGFLADRLEALRRPDGRIGPLVNSTAWGLIALRAAGRPAEPSSVRWLLRRQARGGGWSWAPRSAADADDTAVAVEALRAAGVEARNAAIVHGLAYLRRAQNRDGGFGQRPGLPSNAQTTAWVLQGFAAAARDPGPAARSYLARLRRPDGSYRYSARYGTTPLWVTSYVVPALERRPYPLQ